jgi:hypothetical protein
MKKAIILLFVTVISLGAFAQTRTYEELKKENERYLENTTTLYIQIVGDEQINASDVKLRLVVGSNKQFFVKNKGDFDAMDQVADEIRSLSTIPDALDLLTQRGFIIEDYSTLIFNDMIRHNIILSKTSFR